MSFWGSKSESDRVYSYCLVQNAEKVDLDGDSVWVVDCIDGTRVVLPRIVKEGDQVYFDPYYVNEDTTTLYGYVHSIQQVIP